ncbi:MAG: peptidyl-prolyl cis-trans isomerase [Spirochaetia bacterium]
MKRLGLILSVLLLMVNYLSAQTIDKPVASVYLNESEIISQNQFKQIITLFETNYKRKLTADERKKLLNKLIDEKLIIQAAKKAHIVVTDTEINAMVNQYIENISRQLNRKITKNDFVTLLKKQGKSLNEFEDEVRKMKLADKYVRKAKRSYFQNIAAPSNTEVEDYFNNHRKDFTSPEMIRFKHIFINLQGLNAQEKNDARAKAEEIDNKLKNGGSFDDYWEIFDSSGQKKIGTMVPALLRRDDENSKKIFGADFFNKLFSLQEKQVSNVLTSNVGYHIVFVLEKIPFKTLNLDDKIPPQNAMSVRQYIKAYLTQLKQAQNLQKAIEETTNELRKEADIKIWEENLSW